LHVDMLYANLVGKVSSYTTNNINDEWKSSPMKSPLLLFLYAVPSVVPSCWGEKNEV